MKHLKQLIRPSVLKHIGRPLLVKFLARFATELKLKRVELPDGEFNDNDYFCALAALFKNPEALPDSLLETLIVIDALATPEGREQLEAALAQAGSGLQLTPDSTDEDVAMQVWLAAPALLTRVYNQNRMQELVSFEHFRVRPELVSGEQAPDTSRPRLEALAASLDQWFARHQRGCNNTSLDLYSMDNEIWFLVQHGDTYKRRTRIEQRRIEVLHFRPEKDDVVVYSTAHRELRINARSRSERELYRRQFGLCLWGDAEHFSERAVYTLEPLRTQGPAALDPAGIEGILSITLREIKVALCNQFREITIRQADDLFLCATAKQESDPIPQQGRLDGATFEFRFADTPKPRTVKMCPPNVLKLGRHCHAEAVYQWFALKGYRA